MAHVMAVKAYRESNIKHSRIGIILNVTPAYARSNDPQDQTAQKVANLLLK
uniref:CAZy families GH1 protein n=1 Tax=uncultured Thermoanaerobacterium sp. TaxID=218933 RepID=A0A060CGY6_9THEO|nr:CAZy families GH1 protein [uncultured Thermoanaerobacterium sp.]